MDVADISSFVSTVGFPIAAFCAMWWTCDKSIKEMRDVINELRNTIENLRDDMRERSIANG